MTYNYPLDLLVDYHIWGYSVDIITEKPRGAKAKPSFKIKSKVSEEIWSLSHTFFTHNPWGLYY